MLDQELPESNDPLKKVEFVICVEGGYFEKQAKLLVSSIRQFGGRYADAPIFCYQPRKGFRVSEETVDFFEKNQVSFNDLVLNKRYKYFKFANKPIICSYHEQQSSADVLFYLDCDSLLINDPERLVNLQVNEIGLRPEDAKGHGTNGEMNDEHSVQWKKICKFLSIEHQYPTVRTVVDNKETLAYYNAGQAVVHKDANFFSQWNDNFLRSLNDRIFGREYLIMSDQMMISATAVQMKLKVQEEGRGFNFPLNLYAFDSIENPIYNNAELKKQITLHYHKIFLRGYNPVELEFQNLEYGGVLNKFVTDYDLFHNKNSLYAKVRNKLYKHISQSLYCR